jgi:rod shape-determining protein MreD
MIWRRLIFIVVILGIQGVLGLLLPLAVSPPDLFLLTALAVTSRLSPLWTIAAGYGMGLLQDVLGAGALGFHAAGIMAGAAVAGFVRRGLSSENNINHALGVLVAVIAKWLVFILLGYWTRLSAMTVETLLLRFVPELVATLICGPFLFAFFNWAFGPQRANEGRLL